MGALARPVARKSRAADHGSEGLCWLSDWAVHCGVKIRKNCRGTGLQFAAALMDHARSQFPPCHLKESECSITRADRSK